MEDNFYPRGNNLEIIFKSFDSNEFFSPDRTKKAIVFLFECGATTSTTTRIALTTADKTLADTPLSDDIYATDSMGIDLVWLDNNHVQINHGSAKAYYAKYELHGTKISFYPN